MKFKLVKRDCVNRTCYGQPGISTGDTIELSGHLIDKALNNPDYELVVELPVKKAAPKKRAAPKKKAVKK
jgi:hypothetical protein